MRKTEIKIKKEVFNNIFYPLINNDIRVQILFGGSSSGKSRFTAQRCIYDLLSGERNYLILRNIARTLRVTVFNELQKVISRYNLDHLFTINKSEMSFTCVNGFQAILQGLDDVEKIKSITPKKGPLTDIWIEEATEIKKDDYKQIIRRLRGRSKKKKRITLTFNPILRSHWIYAKWFNPIIDQQLQDNGIYQTDKILILKTTYQDNKFLESDEIEELENETDEYWYQVYTLGNWGILGGVIFRNWHIEDLTKQKKQFNIIRNGLDFGFSKDPAAFVRIHYDRARKKIYIFNELYETGLTNPQLADKIKPIIGNELVVCDNAEPKSIEELRHEGISAQPAKKGKDSIRFGIQWLQQHEIIINQQCQNSVNEFAEYHWKKDRWGESMDEPVNKNNHAIDACRYALEQDQQAGPRIRYLEKAA